MTFKELAELYINTVTMKESTAKNYRYRMNKFSALNNKDIAEISEKDIINLYNSTSKRNIRKCDYEFITLKAIFNFAVKNSFIDKNPMKLTLKRGIPTKIHELLSINQIKMLIDELKKNDKSISCMLLFQLMTGCRISEIRGLKKKYVNINDNTALIIEQYGIVDSFGKQGYTTLKTDYSKRTVYIPAMLQDILYKRIENMNADDVIFAKEDKTIYSVQYINSYLSKICEKLNLPNMTSHCMRALYATIALYSNINIIAVSKQLGHSTTKETERYMRYITELDKKQYAYIDEFLKKLE
ncbi:site-specific recombinase, phage integrase family [Peptoanaerobacter stomatis]|uniref:Site-specific recombinase, phage integrase family n=1 Tax=Peptoanaerobacter stomatis TaxID=796937 RepID=J4W094_9FIRM|nr:site-specific integrase [Peptoanaerobacter stomatis]EJU19761.1 site-specific recombinase, phage integrase family [Peptoanaerobacter stomatis]